MTIELTQKQQEVYKILKRIYLTNGKQPVSPTKIGLEMGVEYDKASAYCTNALKRLMVAGYIEKHPKGLYSPININEGDVL